MDGLQYLWPHPNGSTFNSNTNELYDSKIGVTKTMTFVQFICLGYQTDFFAPAWTPVPAHWDASEQSRLWYTEEFQTRYAWDPTVLSDVQPAWIGNNLDLSATGRLIYFERKFPGHQVTDATIRSHRNNEEKKRDRRADTGPWTTEEKAVVGANLDNRGRVTDRQVLHLLRVKCEGTRHNYIQVADMRAKMAREKYAAEKWKAQREHGL